MLSQFSNAFKNDCDQQQQQQQQQQHLFIPKEKIKVIDKI